MSGRQVRTREVSGSVGELLGLAKGILNHLSTYADMPEEIKAVQWPDLPTFPREDTFIGKIVSSVPGPVQVKGRVTDFQPRKGKSLQRWKLAENAAEMMEVLGSGYREYVDALESAKEVIDADEEMGLKEQLDKINSITEFQETLEDFHRSCEDCAATIRAIQIPNRR